jgi:hypothetical protein
MPAACSEANFNGTRTLIVLLNYFLKMPPKPLDMVYH